MTNTGMNTKSTTATTRASSRTPTLARPVVRHNSLLISRLLAVLALVCVVFILCSLQPRPVAGFIKFGYILNTTACDTCDELRTYSGRNVFCCLAQSKCCGPNSLDELDALTTTPAP